MTIEEFGRRIKQKYPQYNSLDDAVVGDKVINKYPVYRSQIDGYQEEQPEQKPRVEEQRKTSVDVGLRKQLEERGMTDKIKELESTAKKAGLGRNLFKSLKEIFVDPIGRAFLRSPIEAVQGVQSLVPGGKTGKEKVQTPFGEIKPVPFTREEAGKEGEFAETGELLGEAAEVALTFLPVQKLVSPIAKGLSKVFKTARKTQAEEVSSVVGKIIQGKPEDKKQAIEALKILNIKDVKTYADLKQLTKDRIRIISKSLNKFLEKYPEKKLLKDVAVKTKVGKEVVKQDFVTTALDDLQELYTKTAKKTDSVRIKQLSNKAKKEGLSVKEINDIAKEYNVDFGKKAFSARTGEALTSVNAQKYENIRKGIKETARGQILDDTPRLLDFEMSNLYEVQRLASKMETSVNALAQKIPKDRNVIQNIARGLGKGFNWVLGGTPQEFLRAIAMESNIGKKTSNALALEKELASNLKEFDKLVGKTPDDIIEYIVKKIKANPVYYRNALRGVDDVFED